VSPQWIGIWLYGVGGIYSRWLAITAVGVRAAGLRRGKSDSLAMVCGLNG
jgi:hypothetical protein